MTLHFSEINGPPHTGQTESEDFSLAVDVSSGTSPVGSLVIPCGYLRFHLLIADDAPCLNIFFSLNHGGGIGYFLRDIAIINVVGKTLNSLQDLLFDSHSGVIAESSALAKKRYSGDCLVLAGE